MSWITPLPYDKSKFKLNLRRMKDMVDTIKKFESLYDNADNEEAFKMYGDDLVDARYILRNLKSGNVDAATTAYSRLDTSVRDEYPQWLAELAGAGGFNPRYYKPENSLAGTE